MGILDTPNTIDGPVAGAISLRWRALIVDDMETNLFQTVEFWLPKA
jgi:hypothetical protein